MNGAQRVAKEMFILAIGAIAGIYLLNPGAGFVELIPDALPIVGNLDEAGAVAILITILRYYGIDPTDMLARDEETDENDPNTIHMPEQDEWRG